MEDPKQNNTNKVLIKTARTAVIIALLFIVCCVILISTFMWNSHSDPLIPAPQKSDKPLVTSIKTNTIPATVWKAPDESTIPPGKYGNMIRYGRDLVTHTSKYFGPNGSIARITNGMNCQNCHLAQGTKLFGNNYSVFFSSYPKMSYRSGKIAQVTARIAACFERSLAGKVPDESGKEVQAMLAYMKWVGVGVKKGDKIFGSATEKLKYLDRAADPKKGLILYNNKCKSCHGAGGEGLFAADKRAYVYPPLWGDHSYNDGAGMYRLSNFAGFVKNNMPFGASYENPQLSDEEAWDLAAFVNSQSRPHRAQTQDYPDLTKKPIDAPYGPYADSFTEGQHKYGPFQPIVSAGKKKMITANNENNN